MKFSTIFVAALLLFVPAHSQAKISKKVGIITYETAVTEESVDSFLSDLKKAQEKQVDYVVVRISSPGGMVYPGMEMAKAIEDSPIPVICVVDGDAESMGFYILQSCHYRFMTKRSVLMAHEPSGTITIKGKPQDFKDVTNAIETLAKAMEEHEAAKLCISIENFRALIKNQDFFMDWKIAMDIGAVDNAVPSVREVVRDLLIGKSPESLQAESRCRKASE